jgi:1,4-alpha-glucan branching enzyme
MGPVTDKSDIEAIVQARHNDPFRVLGLHLRVDGEDAPQATEGEVVVRTIQPQANRVTVVETASGRELCDLERAHEQGFFHGVIPEKRQRFAYRLRLEFPETVSVIEDAYRFPTALGELDLHLFGEGLHLRAFERLGAHPIRLEGVPGTCFTVWAPNAQRVSVVGDFNNWDGRVNPMRLHMGNGIWELFLPGVQEGARYKFELRGARGQLMPLKADPYAFYSEQPPKTASVVHGIPKYDWTDKEWMDTRWQAHARGAPISIYEVHLGSWQRVPEEQGRYLTYRELADRLVTYVADMGFTHIELMPVCEFPFDGSWGYQPIGLYASTSRFGPPEDFQYFIDTCHKHNIGVLVDWVPGHFPTDQHGLGMFDGTHLYEHADPRKGFHMDWNTLIYNYGRNEVRNFLLGNALYWFETFHIDGIRVDAVASMLYLDYSRKHGEWIPNQYGGNENLEAIDFIKRMNTEVYGLFPGAITVAEESTAWPAVSRPIYAGGLGFGYKWNMGWMNDTLRYMQKDPVHRHWHHNDLTFGLLYAFTENFILPLSHDEVVHGKGSLLDKMSGDEWQRFANLRSYYAFMWTMPGKKLLFMGGEIGQWREWQYDESLDWHLLEYDRHRGLQSLVRDLNALYKKLPALHRVDCEHTGFEWIEANDVGNSVIAYIRKSDDETPPVLIVCNFTPVVREGYRTGVPEGGFWVEILNTDAELYGGSNAGNGGGLMAEEIASQARPYSLNLTLPPLGTIVLAPQALLDELERREDEATEAEIAATAVVEPTPVEPQTPPKDVLKVEHEAQAERAAVEETKPTGTAATIEGTTAGLKPGEAAEADTVKGTAAPAPETKPAGKTAPGTAPSEPSKTSPSGRSSGKTAGDDSGSGRSSGKTAGDDSGNGSGKDSGPGRSGSGAGSAGRNTKPGGTKR